MAITKTVVPSNAGDKGVPIGLCLALTYTAETDYPSLFNELYVGGVGDVTIKGNDGNNFTLSAVPAGSELHVEGRRVLATGTTATLIVSTDTRR